MTFPIADITRLLSHFITILETCQIMVIQTGVHIHDTSLIWLSFLPVPNPDLEVYMYWHQNFLDAPKLHPIPTFHT